MGYGDCHSLLSWQCRSHLSGKWSTNSLWNRGVFQSLKLTPVAPWEPVLGGCAVNSVKIQAFEQYKGVNKYKNNEIK